MLVLYSYFLLCLVLYSHFSSKVGMIHILVVRKGGQAMLGERLAELRKLNDDTQQTLADKLGISVWSIRAWEQGKSYPFSNVLLAICKLYGTSADYLLGLTDIDPSDEARKQRQRLTEEEQNEMHRYEEYLLWKRKK